MTTRSKTTGDSPASAEPTELPPPTRQPAGVPAELLTALALRPEGAELSSPLDIDTLLDQDIAGWRPDAGDKVIGRIVNIELAGQDSAFGAYPIVTIRADGTGELVNVHAFHQVLRKELARRGVGFGDRIGIKYLGRVEGGDYGQYESYRVVAEPAAGVRLTTENVGR